MPMQRESDSPLKTHMDDLGRRVQDVLQQQLQALPPLAPQLLRAMHYACLQGGKRIRPLLCYASAEALGCGPEAADRPACAVELLHCYSLIHDDLPSMDNDDLRRGQPTVHRAFDEATAVLAGDALQALAFRCLAGDGNWQVDDSTRLQMLALLGDAAGYPGMVGGQAIDTGAMGGALSLEELEAMHRLKTGALITASVQLGALCTGLVTEAEYSALSHYSRCVGLAFQVHDDVLDVTGDTATLGKSKGADAAMNKPTYVSLLGLEEAQQKAHSLVDEAIEALQELDARADRLRQIARYIVGRQS